MDYWLPPQTGKIYQNELDAYEALPAYKEVAGKPRVDVIELGAGAGRLVDLCYHYGLSAVQPLDTNDPELADGDFVMKVIPRFQPTYVVVRCPAASDAMSSDVHAPMISSAVLFQVCAEQSQGGRLFLCDGACTPSRHRAREPDRPAGHTGLRGRAETCGGVPVRGKRRWATNSQILAT